ncbi:uncharacterized protein LOC125218082 [Salvia hispanica]|uniref:uncharacterized protein LOC125218082 n=1 Tax=Salvia hispanica TaxID=49212 RepID=UPI002009CD15|nr:uncharacterized protein LOC125218082 [Salvia hispanica]
MKALGASYFKLSLNKQRDKERVAITPHEFGFHVPQKRVVDGVVLFRPNCAVSISSQTNMGSDSSEEAIQTVSSDHPKTVRVRFKLHKQCAFGQQFLVVGDDPNLGLWDPSEGVPLNWSEGHVWAAEVDVPCGKVISYKFVLEEMAGAVMWQPGPDRVLETWDTGKTISVSEDWDSPDFQNVVEEEPVAVDDLNQPSLIDEKAEEEGVDGNVPSLLSSEDLGREVVEEGDDVMREELDGDEHMSDYSDEPVMLLVAENITEEKNSSASDGLMSVAGKEEEETRALGDHGKVAMSGSDSSSLKNETRVVKDDEVPVLVPGLATLPAAEEAEAEEAEAETEASSTDRSTTDLSDEIEDSIDSNQKNSKTFEDAPAESDGIEDSADLNPRNDSVVEDTTTAAAAIEPEIRVSTEKPGRLNREKQILDNDVQWGRRALHKFLANLGFMQHS